MVELLACQQTLTASAPCYLSKAGFTANSKMACFKMNLVCWYDYEITEGLIIKLNQNYTLTYGGAFTV